MKNGMQMTKNFANSDDAYILLKWGVIIKCYGGEKFQKVQYDPLPPTIKHKTVIDETGRTKIKITEFLALTRHICTIHGYIYIQDD